MSILADKQHLPPPGAFFLPTRDYRRTLVKTPARIAKGLDAVVHDFVGRWRRSPLLLKKLSAEARVAANLARDRQGLSSDRLRLALRASADLFRGRRAPARELLLDTLANLAATAERTLGLFPHEEQLLAVLALHGGYLIEMATGEGKSLCGCLAGVLAAWSGRPCHVLTVNDYLAQRDAEGLRPFYHLCGVSSEAVGAGMGRDERRRMYEAGVVYTTGKELLADFLRDRLQLGVLHHPTRRILHHCLDPELRRRDGLVLRGLDTAIVDEADSVLIDEAVTPLIISEVRENKLMADAAKVALEIAASLERNVDYHVDHKHQEVRLTARGYEAIAAITSAMPGLWRGAARRVELVQQALTVKAFIRRDRQYIVEDEKVVIVDEYTGRLMPDRSWSHGLHQIIEAVEGLPGTNPTETLASLSFQRFFRLFRKLSGMTGTARETISELWKIYRLPVVLIPTHNPVRRRNLSDKVFATSEKKWQAVVAEILKLQDKKRPVLIGTRNVADSERLAVALSERGVVCNVLNAVRHRDEARIVAEAGRRGMVTIATNMAGRGTDIKLGEGVEELGGLHVIATERHDSGRVDRQLFGRCARQGEPGSAQAFVSLEDEVLRRFVPAWLLRLLQHALDAGLPRAMDVVGIFLAIAQLGAQRLAFRRRKGVLETDTWLDEALFFSGRSEGGRQRPGDLPEIVGR